MTDTMTNEQILLATFAFRQEPMVYLSAALEAIEAATRQANQWRPIADAPKDGARVLIVNEEGNIDVACYVPEWSEHQEFVREAEDGNVYRTVREDTGYWNTEIAYCPTHWRPLPLPPTGTEQDKL